MGKEKENNVQIPYGKAVRVGNFKLWRCKYGLGSGKEKYYMDCVHVSSLSGSWGVRIPADIEMYGILSMAYASYKSEDEQTRQEGEQVLGKLLSNMFYTTSVANGFFQRGIELCAVVYANPSLLNKKDKEHKAFVSEVRHTVEDFLDWRKGYDARMAEYEPTEEQEHQDELAEQAMEILGNQDEEEGG